MTRQKHLKRRIRERAEKTGERYTAARRHLQPSQEITVDDAPLTLDCSFCRKSDQQVRQLVAGPGVFICDECTALAATIVESEQARRAVEDTEPVPLDDRPVDELLAVVEGLAAARRANDETLVRWLAALERKGVSPDDLARATGDR